MTLWRLKFSITGRLRYLSHLDLLNHFERALRRGDMPVRYSQGFNPHMLMSFGPAHSVGMEALGDYMDIETEDDVTAAQWSDFNRFLPDGIRIEEARKIDRTLPSLMQAINIAEYSLRLSAFEAAEVQQRIVEFFAAESVPFERITPKGSKMLDLRPAVLSLDIDDGALLMRIRMLDSGTPRPAEIAQTIVPEARVLHSCRTALYIEAEDGGLLLP